VWQHRAPLTGTGTFPFLQVFVCDGGGRRGAKGSGVVAEGRVVNVMKGRIYMIHIRKSVFFFYAVLDQVLLSPGNIAMY